MPLVSRDDSVLVVIDVQPGFAANPAMNDAERAAAAATVDRIAWLAAYAAELAVPAVVVEENPARNGTTDARILERLDARAHVKPTFGIGGCPEAIEALTASGRGTAVLVGFESDVCVAQSAIALLDRGLRVAVPDDGVYTSGELEHRRGLARMAAAGAEPLSCKGVVYEWVDEVEVALATIRRVSDAYGPAPMRL